MLAERNRLIDEHAVNSQGKKRKILDLNNRLKCLKELPAKATNQSTTILNLEELLEKRDGEILELKTSTPRAIQLDIEVDKEIELLSKRIR